MKITKFLLGVIAFFAFFLPQVSCALEKNDKILIAYFSQTNNTERLAEDLIKGLTDYDVTLTEIVSVDPYSENMEKMSPMRHFYMLDMVIKRMVTGSGIIV